MQIVMTDTVEDCRKTLLAQDGSGVVHPVDVATGQAIEPRKAADREGELGTVAFRHYLLRLDQVVELADDWAAHLIGLGYAQAV